MPQLKKLIKNSLASLIIWMNSIGKSLGFDKFLIDSRLVSLLGRLGGIYVQLTMKARKNHLHDSVEQYKSRFNQIGKAKNSLHMLTYSEKLIEIQKYENELKQLPCAEVNHK